MGKGFHDCCPAYCFEAAAAHLREAAAEFDGERDPAWHMALVECAQFLETGRRVPHGASVD